MEIIIILLFLILISLVIGILYSEAYNKLIIIKKKMDKANDNITELLNKKFELMKQLYEIIKKIVQKKDYLKGFSALNNQKLSNYELDNELNTHLKTMIDLKEDYKDLNSKECNTLFDEIKAIDQDIIASKKFFNRNNNLLIKALHGYTKIIAKIKKINVKTSYEIKKPE